MIKTNFHLVLDGFRTEHQFGIAKEKGFSGAIITIETDSDVNLGINEQFYPVKFIENLSVYDFSKIISCNNKDITQAILDSVCEIISDNTFFVYSVEYNLSVFKEISRDLWLDFSEHEK